MLPALTRPLRGDVGDVTVVGAASAVAEVLRLPALGGAGCRLHSRLDAAPVRMADDIHLPSAASAPEYASLAATAAASAAQAAAAGGRAKDRQAEPPPPLGGVPIRGGERIDGPADAKRRRARQPPRLATLWLASGPSADAYVQRLIGEASERRRKRQPAASGEADHVSLGAARIGGDERTTGNTDGCGRRQPRPAPIVIVPREAIMDPPPPQPSRQPTKLYREGTVAAAASGQDGRGSGGGGGGSSSSLDTLHWRSWKSEDSADRWRRGEPAQRASLRAPTRERTIAARRAGRGAAKPL